MLNQRFDLMHISKCSYFPEGIDILYKAEKRVDSVDECEGLGTWIDIRAKFRRKRRSRQFFQKAHQDGRSVSTAK